MRKNNAHTAPTDRTNRNLREATQTGLRVNQVAMDWVKLLLQHGNLAHDWQQGFSQGSSMFTGEVSISQRQVAQGLELMGRSIRVKADLLERASAAAQAPSLPESQARWMNFWMAAARLAHSNATTLARINGAAFDSWFRMVGFARK